VTLEGRGWKIVTPAVLVIFPVTVSKFPGRFSFSPFNLPSLLRCGTLTDRCATQSIHLGEKPELVEILFIFGRDMAIFQRRFDKVRPGKIREAEYKSGVGDLG
jgi:hypothetical protein